MHEKDLFQDFKEQKLTHLLSTPLGWDVVVSTDFEKK